MCAGKFAFYCTDRTRQLTLVSIATSWFLLAHIQDETPDQLWSESYVFPHMVDPVNSSVKSRDSSVLGLVPIEHWWSDDWSPLPFCQLPRPFYCWGDSLHSWRSSLLSSSSGGCSVSQCCSSWSSLCSLLLLLQEERTTRKDQGGGRGVYCCCPELCETQQEECLMIFLKYISQIVGKFNKYE